MTLELRVLSGTRAGANEKFEKPIIAIGRHALSDLRFDPKGDLDVSTRHAELRQDGDVWTVYDENSTNGTFINGERIAHPRRLNDGDVLSFGANGPRVEVRGIMSAPVAPPTRMSSAVSAPTGPPRKGTEIRVAEAVHAQTKSMRRTYSGLLGLLIVAGGAGIFFWQQQSSKRERDLLKMIQRSESTMTVLQTQINSVKPGDSSANATLQAELDARKAANEKLQAQIKSGTAPKGSVTELSKQIDNSVSYLTKVHDMNDAAVAMVASDFDGKYIAGTAFGVARGGLLITNRHVVKTAEGLHAGRIMVIFANTPNAWLPAHIVRLGEGADDDLALIQIDVPGTYPVVAAVSRTGALAKVGASVAAIGFPGATDLPMEGSGLKITPRTTMTAGTVSKRLDNVIQLDSYSAHGASGSPLFDTAGSVVGVIYGGDAESHGKIVYAVPAQRLAAFLGADGAAVLK